MLEVKRIDPESAGKVVSLVVAGVVLIVGIMYILLILVTLFLTILAGKSVDNGGLFLMIVGGLAMTLICVVLGALLGFVKGWICAALYNWVAHAFGGVLVSVSEQSIAPSATVKTLTTFKPESVPTLKAPKDSSKSSRKRKVRRVKSAEPSAPAIT